MGASGDGLRSLAHALPRSTGSIQGRPHFNSCQGFYSAFRTLRLPRSAVAPFTRMVALFVRLTEIV
jgi:hypothetical protein